MNRSGLRLPGVRRVVSSVTAVVALVAGLLVLQTTVAKQPEASASTVGGSITRAEIIARAKYWYDRGDTWYSQQQSDAISDGDGHSYRPDCSGFVAMAWHLPKKSDGWDLNTDDFHTYTHKSWLGSPHDLLPGDALLKDGHMELFEKWVNPADHTDGAWVYSENDYGQRTNHNINDWDEMETYRGIRYDKVVGGSPVSDGGGDFDTNGVGDIYLSLTGTLTIWNGKGSNNFTGADAVGPGWTAFSRPAAGDFNKDGKTDLAAVKDTSTLYVWNGEGKNNFSSAKEVGPGWGPFPHPVAGDFNNDGRSDLAAVKNGSTLHIWNGDGTNTFSSAKEIGPGWTPYF